MSGDIFNNRIEVIELEDNKEIGKYSVIILNNNIYIINELDGRLLNIDEIIRDMAGIRKGKRGRRRKLQFKKDGLIIELEDLFKFEQGLIDRVNLLNMLEMLEDKEKIRASLEDWEKDILNPYIGFEGREVNIDYMIYRKVMGLLLEVFKVRLLNNVMEKEFKEYYEIKQQEDNKDKENMS